MIGSSGIDAVFIRDNFPELKTKDGSFQHVLRKMAQSFA